MLFVFFWPQKTRIQHDEFIRQTTLVIVNMARSAMFMTTICSRVFVSCLQNVVGSLHVVFKDVFFQPMIVRNLKAAVAVGRS